MSYTVNQINYATPISSAASLRSEDYPLPYKKYFTLFDNVLNGTYRPVSGDAGLWGTSLSDDNGYLPEPYEITVTDIDRVKAFRLAGSASQCYPVDFTVSFYNGNTLVYGLDVRDNHAIYSYYFYRDLIVTHYVVRITRISKPNAVVRLHNLYEPFVMKRNSAETIGTVTLSSASSVEASYLHSYSNVYLGTTNPTSSVKNSLGSDDDLNISTHTNRDLHNIHSIMKQPSRRVYGKVNITYTDPMLKSDSAFISNTTAYNSRPDQVMDGVRVPSDLNLFTLYDNNLSGQYVVSGENTQVGWSSSVLSGPDGYFEVPPVLTINVASRPAIGLPIIFNDAKGCIVEDFSVRLVQNTRAETVLNFTGNTSREVTITDETLINVVTIEITFYKMSKAGYPATLLEIPIASTILYKGYHDESDLISIDLLEELTYEDEVEALGGVSANEITVVLDNSNKDFYFNNTLSPVATQLKRNRKIVPWLGAEVVPGEIEWHPLGTFWSYRWDVPVNGLTATVVGFDTIGLLDTTSFTNHHVQINKSVGELIEYVLNDASRSLDFIEYNIDPALYEIIIPYAWFEAGSHTAALRKISGCFPMHIYCDRYGRICAMPQKLRLDYYYDTWSDSTNVIDKSYSSLYTTLPNIMNVTVMTPILVHNDELAKDDRPFNVSGAHTKTVNFNKPYVRDLAVSVDTSVPYTYEAYSWGCVFTFTGTGTVNSIICTGTAIDTSNTSVINSVDEESVHLNGAVTREVQSDFIQSDSLANMIIGRIESLATHDKYDASVNYRGDIALTINDPIRLLDGIAPDNRYNIKRHQLFWNGSLSGSADLNI